MEGRAVILVDDVMTTGTTLSECARVLKEAGAERVWAVTVARAFEGASPGPIPNPGEEEGIEEATAASVEQVMSTQAQSAASRYGKSLAGCMHHARVAGEESPQWVAMHAPVLVLNASYEPINVCAARRAIVLVLKGVAMMEEANGHFLHAARVAMRVPSVIRLLEYRRIPHQTRALSRKNILLRDRNTCQYCGTMLPPAN